jgi:hypothetical protein
MKSRPPFIIDGKAPDLIPASILAGRDRSRRPLYVMGRTIYFRTRHGWLRVPRGYVTDFASIPGWATLLTGLDLQALGPWAWAALAHDWLYAIGQPGWKDVADDVFRERMDLDGVGAAARTILYQAVHLFGGAGYAEAPSWWDTENFADPVSGRYPITPPFPRQLAFEGEVWGLRLTRDCPWLRDPAPAEGR